MGAKLDVERELAVCEAATKGPWRFSKHNGTLCSDAAEQCVGSAVRDCDGRFIASARTHYPELLASFKRLRELLGPLCAVPENAELREILYPNQPAEGSDGR